MTGEASKEQGQPPADLAILRCVTAAYRGVLSQPIAFAKAASIPVVIVAAISLAYEKAPWSDNPFSPLFFGLLILPHSYLSFIWLRLRLFGGMPGILPRPPWIADYLKLFAHAVFWALLLFACPIAIIVGAAELLFRFVENPWIIRDHLRTGWIPSLVWIALSVIFLFTAARLALAVPSTIAGLTTSPRAAWRLGTGSGRKLGGGLVILLLSQVALQFIVLFVGYFILRSLSALADIPLSSVWEDAVLIIGLHASLLIGTAVIAEFLADAFRILTGWQDPVLRIAERFD